MNEEKFNDSLDVMIRYNIMKQSSNPELGITQEYNKTNRDKLWDSTKGKSQYKDKIFGDKQIYDDKISGKKLHKSQSAAQNKYHMKNSDGENISSKWAEHSSETDHINALKDVHDIAKHNPFLTDNDFKEITNSDENYRILSKSDNAAKGDKNDWQIIADKNSRISSEGKVQMVKEKIKSDIYLHSKFAEKTAKNIGNEFISGAADTVINSAIPLTAEAVRNMIEVAQKKKSVSEAASDMGKITVDVAVKGGINKLLVDAASITLRNSKNSILQRIAGSNEVSQIIAVASIVKESAVKYIDGEINEKEFIEEVGVKGATMAASMIGGQIGQELGSIIGAAIGTTVMPGTGTAAGYLAGKVIGEVLGVIITTISCGIIVSVYNTNKHLNDYKLKESQIRKLENAALAEMSRQRSTFKEIVEREYHRWDEELQAGFDMMLSNACEQAFNLQGVTDGLDKILAIFGKSVAFKTLDEYEAQLGTALKLSF